MPKKKTNEVFLIDLKNKAPRIKALGPYVNSTTKISFQCLECGNIWSAAPSKILFGRGCPKCSRKRTSDRKRYTTEAFSEKLSVLNPNIEVVGDYISSTTKITVHCKKCNNTWDVVPSSLLQGTGCPKCNKRYRRNNQEFIDELKKAKPNITALEEYKSANTSILVKCNRCGNTWYARPNDLLKKTNDCPACAHSQTSTIEQIILNSFIKLVGKDKVHSRDKKIIGKELDIYIEGLQIAIEFGAWHWHSYRIEQDVEKEKLCEHSGIKLITIYEGCPEDADTGELRSVLKYRKVLSNEKRYETIQKILLKICNSYDLDSNILIDQWPTIIKQAREESRKRDAEDFAKELSVRNPEIAYIGGYTGVKDPVYVLCKKCGNKWNASSAYNLLNGRGCPKCARVRMSVIQRTDPEEFRDQVRAINPHITLLREYDGPNNNVLCKCEKCGMIWEAKPANIKYSKTNCPNCSKTAKKTNDTFRKELAKISSDIIPLEDYINRRTGIRFKCKICGWEWNARPSDILKGTGCPKCANRITISHDEFVERVKQANDKVEIIGQYRGSKARIKCRCAVCGYEWLGIPSNLMRGAGCQKCAGTKRLSQTEFNERLSIVNPTIKSLTPYVSNKTKVRFLCTVCGNEWEAQPGNILNGHGCPKCKAYKTRALKSKKVICIETGMIYESISIAKAETGITSISDCLHNRTKTAGGYHWKYY